VGSALALIARIAGIGIFCCVATYLAAAAFVPSMATGGWDFLIIGFAGLGLALGVYGAVRTPAKNEADPHE